jgi:hypothetical protein
MRAMMSLVELIAHQLHILYDRHRNPGLLISDLEVNGIVFSAFSNPNHVISGPFLCSESKIFTWLFILFLVLK